MDRPGGREVADKADPRALESFVRALVGVREAVVETEKSGRPERIWVVPASGVPERQVRLNIISALMAGPGIALDPSALRIVEAIPDPTSPEADTVPAVQLKLNGHKNVHANGAHANGNGNGNGAHAMSNGSRPDSAAEGGGLHLVRFEIETPAAGRIRVIVGVESGGHVGLGVREGDDRPGVALDLAAQAAADAARATGGARGAFQVAGVGLSEVAGRTHVIVAVDVWTGGDFAARPGAAAVLASYEEAAARAVLAALGRY